MGLTGHVTIVQWHTGVEHTCKPRSDELSLAGESIVTLEAGIMCM